MENLIKMLEELRRVELNTRKPTPYTHWTDVINYAKNLKPSDNSDFKARKNSPKDCSHENTYNDKDNFIRCKGCNTILAP